MPSSSILSSPSAHKICEEADINIILKYCLFDYLRYFVFEFISLIINSVLYRYGENGIISST